MLIIASLFIQNSSNIPIAFLNNLVYDKINCIQYTQSGLPTHEKVQRSPTEGKHPSPYAIAKALNYIVYKAKVVVEPSAAIGVAALISGGFKVKPGEKVCFVLTGGNIDPKKLIDLTEC